MNKKAIAILGAIFILIVGTLGFLIISKYSSKSTKNNTAQTSDGSNNASSSPSNVSTSTAGSLGQNKSPLVKLTNGIVVSPVLFYNGSGVTYFGQDGKLYQGTFDKTGAVDQLTRIHSLEIPLKTNVSQALWPSRGDDFIVSMGGNSSGQYSYFNSKTSSYVDLPPQMKMVSWMPQGDKIVYIWSKDGKFSLQTSSPDGTNWQNVGTMYQPDNALSVSPDGLTVAFFRTASSDVNNSIYSVSIDGKVWKTFVKDGFNTGVLWSPDSKKLLFAKRDSSTGSYQLWYYDIPNNEAKNLGLFATVDKAVWNASGTMVYAAVSNANGSGDSLVAIDVKTMAKKQYSMPADTSVTIGNLFLSNSEDKIYFKNLNDGSLYYYLLGK